MTDEKPTPLTAREKKAIALAVRTKLAERFPAAFKGQGETKPPLMIGVSAEIMLRCPDLSRRDLGFAMFDYTNGSTYLRSFVPGAQRIDLDGNPVGEVTAADIQNAQTRLRALMAGVERAADRRRVGEACEQLRVAKAERAETAAQGAQ